MICNEFNPTEKKMFDNHSTGPKEMENGRMHLTEDHTVLTIKGHKRVGDIGVGDTLFTTGLNGKLVENVVIEAHHNDVGQVLSDTRQENAQLRKEIKMLQYHVLVLTIWVLILLGLLFYVAQLF